jgi:hypothetical protein
VKTKPKVAIGAAAALLVLVALILAGVALRRREMVGPPRAGSVLAAILIVEEFHAGDPAPRSWTSAAFADSLVARLSLMPGLTVRRAGGSFGPRSAFTVRGDVTARDGRLVIAARLYREQDRDAVWTATFWRTDSLTVELVSDLAAGVSEALYGELARGANATTGGGP